MERKLSGNALYAETNGLLLLLPGQKDMDVQTIENIIHSTKLKKVLIPNRKALGKDFFKQLEMDFRF